MIRARAMLTVLLLFAHAEGLIAAPPGQRVAVIRQTQVVRDGKVTDQLPMGSVLTVLSVHDKNLWVSRGNPGWISSAATIDLEKAEAYFDSKLASDRSARNYMARGLVLTAVGKHQSAERDLLKATQLNSSDPAFFEALGLAYFQGFQLSEAKSAFNNAILRKPDSATAFIGRGICLVEMGEYEKAIIDLDRSIELAPEHAFALAYRGVAKLENGQVDAAQSDLNKALAIDEFNGFAYRMRGRLHFQLSNLQFAFKDFSFAIKADANDIEAYNGRGVVLFTGGDLIAAEKDFQTATSLATQDIHHAHLWGNLGQAQVELGKEQDALKNITIAINLDSQFSEAYCHRAWLRCISQNDQIRDLDKSKSDVQRAWELSPTKDFWVYYIAATVNDQIGNPDYAKKLYGMAVSVADSFAPARFKKFAMERIK